MNTEAVKTCYVTLDRECHESKAGHDVSKACIEYECRDQTHTDMFPIVKIYSYFNHNDDGSNCQLQGV